MKLQEAIAAYEQAKQGPIPGAQDRHLFSEMDAGLKNPYSGSFLRLRYDGTVEMLAAGEKPAGLRANPAHGILNLFGTERVSAFAPQVAFVTEDGGLELNGHALNYDVLEAGKLVFLSDQAIANLRTLLSQGLYGTPAAPIPVTPVVDGVEEMPLFEGHETGPRWDPLEEQALISLGLEKEAGLE